MNDKLLPVSFVLPEADKDVVIQDLSFTGSTEETINRISDGRVRIENNINNIESRVIYEIKRFPAKFAPCKQMGRYK